MSETRLTTGAIHLTERDGRWKYVLAARPLSGGAIVDLCFSGGWVTGSFDWSGDPSQPPHFHYSIELETDGAIFRGSLPIPEGAVMRWPA